MTIGPEGILVREAQRTPVNIYCAGDECGVRGSHGRLLGRYSFVVGEIKCSRCGALNRVEYLGGGEPRVWLASPGKRGKLRRGTRAVVAER